MASVNRVILIGNCGRDPEVRYMSDGKAVANVSIATSTRRKDRNTGETIEDVQWHRITFYERLAEVAGEFVKKGKPIYVEGRLKYGKYTDKDGVERNTCDIIATELKLLGGRDDQGGGQGGGQGDAPRQQPQRQQQPQQRSGYQGQGQQQRQPPQQRPQTSGGSGFDDMDDDIPF